MAEPGFDLGTRASRAPRHEPARTAGRATAYPLGVSAEHGVDVRAAALAAGYALAAPAAGEGGLRPSGLTPRRLRAWAEALAALHATEPPDAVPRAPFPDWLAQVPQPWPVDVAPLLAQAALIPQTSAAAPGGRPRLCHRRWWLRHARFTGDDVVSIGGWNAAGLGDPAGDVASVEVGLVADGASAAVAEFFAGAFATAYASAAGSAPPGVAPWRVALVGEQLAAALAARARGEPGAPAAAIALWARMLGRLLSARRQD